MVKDLLSGFHTHKTACPVASVGNFSIKSHSGGGREAGGGGSSLDGKLSRDPGVCACAEVAVSGATCAAALCAHAVAQLPCARTQLRAHTADL